MALKKKPVNGMKDILPDEMAVRDYVSGIIIDTYKKYGFLHIETPAMESIENLSSKQGGENEKLIFKVLKRGEKLNIPEAKEESEVVDYGMRYDLTVPLARFYSNNANDLPQPFKALQMGPVWRADRPQRGRYRQFTQCDIDILGESTNLAEIELILATTETLGRIGFSGFEIHISDRRLLRAMADYAGFDESSFDQVCIILDKMDKIGREGVNAELRENGYPEEQINRFTELFDGINDDEEGIEKLAEILGYHLQADIKENLLTITAAVNEAKSAEFKLVFDPTLVRGMGYYTGTIFEIIMPEFGAACGGGGRYDRMIGRFTGNDTPACGFSIGFERIVLLLLESGFTVPGTVKKAYLLEKKCGAEKLNSVLKEANEEREKGMTVLVARMNKNKKFQKEQLEKMGYTDITEIFEQEDQ